MCTRAQIDREILRLRDTTGATNLTGVANNIVDHRSTQDLPVDHDGGAPANISSRVKLKPGGRILT